MELSLLNNILSEFIEKQNAMKISNGGSVLAGIKENHVFSRNNLFHYEIHRMF